LAFLALDDLSNGILARVKQWTKGRVFLKRTGYVYRPHLSRLANHILQEDGLICEYLAHRARFDEPVRLVESPRMHIQWRHHAV
jgi:hypothetical protein